MIDQDDEDANAVVVTKEIFQEMQKINSSQVRNSSFLISSLEKNGKGIFLLKSKAKGKRKTPQRKTFDLRMEWREYDSFLKREEKEPRNNEAKERETMTKRVPYKCFTLFFSKFCIFLNLLFVVQLSLSN